MASARTAAPAEETRAHTRVSPSLFNQQPLFPRARTHTRARGSGQRQGGPTPQAWSGARRAGGRLCVSVHLWTQ